MSIHITNFGNLQNFDYTFKEDISTFCENNGYGKSTIVAFIKAMLFGLETVSKNAKQFLDRKHYYPFVGGTFGGNMVIEYDNKTYRIERTFDRTSEVRDTLNVYLNNSLTNELGDVPGVTIFGISKGHFVVKRKRRHTHTIRRRFRYGHGKAPQRRRERRTVRTEGRTA